MRWPSRLFARASAPCEATSTRATRAKTPPHRFLFPTSPRHVFTRMLTPCPVDLPASWQLCPLPESLHVSAVHRNVNDDWENRESMADAGRETLRGVAAEAARLVSCTMSSQRRIITQQALYLHLISLAPGSAEVRAQREIATSASCQSGPLAPRRQVGQRSLNSTVMQRANSVLRRHTRDCSRLADYMVWTWSRQEWSTGAPLPTAAACSSV